MSDISVVIKLTDADESTAVYQAAEGTDIQITARRHGKTGPWGVETQAIDPIYDCRSAAGQRRAQDLAD